MRIRDRLRMMERKSILKTSTRTRVLGATCFISWLGVSAIACLGAPPSAGYSDRDAKSTEGLFRKSGTARLALIPGREIIEELTEMGRFTPAAPFYAGRMG